MAPLIATAEALSLSSPTIEDRAVRATLACVARHGLAKTTFDDVAREAGCARATLYRYFGGKRQLVRITLVREAARLAASIDSRSCSRARSGASPCGCNGSRSDSENGVAAASSRFGRP